MRQIGLPACFFLFSCTLAAQDSTKPNLSGTWRLDPVKSEMHAGRISDATWVIEEKETTIHITETETGKEDRKIELRCTTDGKDCDVQGQKARASFWYNGSMLVEMETHGDNTTRYRMKLSPDGAALNVEVTYIVPQSEKPEKLVFSKLQ